MLIPKIPAKQKTYIVAGTKSEIKISESTLVYFESPFLYSVTLVAFDTVGRTTEEEITRFVIEYH